MPYGKKRINWRQRMRLGWGKIRRFLLFTLNPDYVRRQHAKRNGECVRCGACCKLMLKCPALEERAESEVCSSCSIHKNRPPNCSIFPIDERDMKDRDLINAGAKCGYSFPKDKKR